MINVHLLDFRRGGGQSSTEKPLHHLGSELLHFFSISETCLQCLQEATWLLALILLYKVCSYLSPVLPRAWMDIGYNLLVHYNLVNLLTSITNDAHIWPPCICQVIRGKVTRLSEFSRSFFQTVFFDWSAVLYFRARFITDFLIGLLSYIYIKYISRIC